MAPYPSFYGSVSLYPKIWWLKSLSLMVSMDEEFGRSQPRQFWLGPSHGVVVKTLAAAPSSEDLAEVGGSRSQVAHSHGLALGQWLQVTSGWALPVPHGMTPGFHDSE